jgi:hypothetical protein
MSRAEWRLAALPEPICQLSSLWALNLSDCWFLAALPGRSATSPRSRGSTSQAARASWRSLSRSASSRRSRRSTSAAAPTSRGSPSRSASSRRSRRSTFPAEEERPAIRGRLVINSARCSVWASRLHHRQQQKQQDLCFTTPPVLRKCRMAFACRTPLRTHISNSRS